MIREAVNLNFDNGLKELVYRQVFWLHEAEHLAHIASQLIGTPLCHHPRYDAAAHPKTSEDLPYFILCLYFTE